MDHTKWTAPCSDFHSVVRALSFVRAWLEVKAARATRKKGADHASDNIMVRQSRTRMKLAVDGSTVDARIRT
eukprot:SAG11_NODE_1506_length_4781_cov_2.355831_2_plen_72_part_00